jgi:perosamine synthetase
VQYSIQANLSRPEIIYPLAHPKIGKIERDLLVQAFDSGWISSAGEFIEKFQNDFASYVGTKFGVATSNGTTALHLALLACGIGVGDEVIVPDLTFVAPANMVLQTGAEPKFADSNNRYWGVDSHTIQKRITNRTKAIIVVHLYGHPVDLDPITELCESKDLILIEDCAEAHGAIYRGKCVGSFGHISCFSFYGNKLLTTGEGGMCLTNDPSLQDKMKLLRDHGADRKRSFWHPVSGFNYRMTNLQAAIGIGQLKGLNKRIDKYRQIGNIYTTYLSELMGQRVIPHPTEDWAKCVFWMYTCLIRDLAPQEREKVRVRLRKKGIETRPIFYPISKLPPFQKFSGDNPVAWNLSKGGISLPTYQDLEPSDIHAIVKALADVIKQVF